jgi:hypothetical protein
MIFLLALSLVSLIMTLRAFLIVVGTYKDPVLASFENYGEEKIFSPISSLTMWGVIFVYVTLFLYFQAAMVVVMGLAITIILASFRETFQEWLYTYHQYFRMFPRWYFELVQRTDREERRRIAYLWLRLPLQTRLLYNARSEFFHQWVDLVLLSITR